MTAITPDVYPPDRAQTLAVNVLHAIGVDVAPGVTVLLTDADAGQRCDTHRVNPGQMEAACDQYRLITGEDICADALIGAMPWA